MAFEKILRALEAGVRMWKNVEIVELLNG